MRHDLPGSIRVPPNDQYIRSVNMKMDLPAPVARALSELERSGHQGYVVGGCVRDSLMGRTPGDYDITTSALPEQVQACFSGERVVPTGIKHGTVTVILDGMPLEITTFRADGEYSDHRRPDSVSFSTRLEDDLCRRDFTINAMADSPQRGLIDLYGGVEMCIRDRLVCAACGESKYVNMRSDANYVESSAAKFGCRKK